MLKISCFRSTLLRLWRDQNHGARERHAVRLLFLPMGVMVSDASTAPACRNDEWLKRLVATLEAIERPSHVTHPFLKATLKQARQRLLVQLRHRPQAL